MPETEAAPSTPYPTALERFPTLRQSRLATFDNCALQAKFDMDHREGWSGHPQGRGQIFHRFAAKALEQMANLDERSIEPEDALSILRECLRQHDVEPRDVVAVPFKQIKDLRWVVIKFAHENVFDVQHLASIEERMEAPLLYENPQGGWVTRVFTGQPDALFIPEPDWGVVLDWKDTWALPPKNELSESGYFQQRAYAFLVMSRYPAIERVTLREHYVRYSEFREATLFRSELENMRDELSALAERFDRAVEHGVWPPEKKNTRGGDEYELWTPSPGAHCTYCPRPTSCPIFPAARVEGGINDPETAERWAAEQIVAKAAASQRDKALRAWASARGPIHVKHAKDPNRVLGFHSAERTSRPTKEELERALEMYGADLDPSTLYDTRVQTRFEQHSHKAAEETADDATLMSALEESLRRQREER